MILFVSLPAREIRKKKSETRLSLQIVCVSLCLLLSSFLVPPVAHAADIAIYDRMLEITRQELRINARGDTTAEPTVIEAVKRMLPFVENPDEVDNADVVRLLDDDTTLCEHQNINYFTQCPVVSDTAKTLIIRETDLRTLGRDLQIIASGFEEPILGGFALPFTSRLQGIARLWRADIADPNAPEGDEEATHAGAVRIRTEEPPDGDALRGLLQQLFNQLESLVITQEYPVPPGGTEPPPPQRDITKLSAAVWRYRFAGAKWLRGMRRDLPQPSPDVAGTADETERELLQKRWTDIENTLIDIANTLSAQAEQLEVAPGEAVLFSLPRSLRDLLPDNVDLAAYAERTQDGELTGDAGLRWIHALEPVQVTLCADDNGACRPVPGGHYPPSQAENTVSAMCTPPAMRPGLLCSEYSSERAGMCAEEVTSVPDTVQLAACTGTEPLRLTEPGGDVCAAATWNPEAEPGQKECHIAFRCEGIDYDASTAKKDEETNTITITINNDPVLPPVPVALMQLAHARQACNAPAGSNPFDEGKTPEERRTTCCRIEGDSHRAACQAMTEDGVFAGNSFTEEGIPINAETCTDILTDEWCRIHDFGSCPGSFTARRSDDDVQTAASQIRAHAAEWLQTHNAEAQTPEDRMPETCEELINPEAPMQRDPRIDAAVNAIENSSNGVCTPLREISMANTVGNLMCYINRCWSESLGRHRLIPGRTPITSGGDAYPFDVCMRPDPGLGNVIPTVSPEDDRPPAPYRPELLLRHLEEALCPGLPLGSPLCTFDVSRRVDLPLNSLTNFSGDIAQQSDEFRQPEIAMRQLSESLGMRIGTRMYGDFLSRRSQALTDFTVAAAALLTQFTRAQFPSTLCPMNDGGLIEANTCGLSESSSAGTPSSDASSVDDTFSDNTDETTQPPAADPNDWTFDPSFDPDLFPVSAP